MKKIPRWLVAAFAVMLLALLGGGWWFYQTQEQRLRAKTEDNLQAISNLKVAQIAQWRAERLAIANEILERSFTRDVVARWMVSPQADTAEQILSWFRSIQKYYQFSDVLLVDAGGLPHLSLSGKSDLLQAEAMQALETAFRERQSVISDLYMGIDEPSPRAVVVAPLFSENEKGAAPIGALVQQIDPRQFLYPLISSWPTPSRSAETLLVRRDGDSVLFLNEVRHRKKTALNMRIPLTSKEVPAVTAALGKEGMVDGKDYRGIEVLAILKHVPDSPWFMVAKVDKAEILADWRILSIIILALVLGLVIAMAAAIGMAWQHYAKTHYRALFESEAALRESEARYVTTVMSIGDGVITTDAEGRVDLLNPVAEALTGWREEEARGKPVTEVFRIINQETRKKVESPVDRVLREGVVVGLANHTLLIARDGRERPIADCGAPIRCKKGDITGVVLVFRDRSKELAVLNELRESEDKFRNLYDEAPVGYIELDREGRIERVNKKVLEIVGYAAEEMMGRHMWDFAVERKAVEETIDTIRSGHRPPSEALERTYKRKKGPPVSVLIQDQVARDSEGKITRIRVTVQDITERKQAEDQLKRAKEDLETRVLERTAELERSNRELQDFAYVASHDLQEPLRKIQVFGDLLADRYKSSLDPSGRNFIARIVKAASRMQTLLESLLAYSRIDKKDRPFQETDLKDTVNEALSLLEVLILVNSARVEVEELPRIAVDQVQIVQLFQNLIANALKFKRDGETPHIRIYARDTKCAVRETCEIYVEDNGIGFDEKYLDRVFMPFQRLHGRDKYEGVGMGLAICKKIVERHGGTITARSTPGKGSTFIITLPSLRGEQ